MKSEKRRRNVLVSVRFTPAELAQVQEAAEGPVSGYLRRLAMAASAQSVNPLISRTVNGNWMSGCRPTSITIQG